MEATMHSRAREGMRVAVWPWGFVLLACGGLLVAAQADVSVSLQPDPACAQYGATFTVDLRVDSAGSPFNGYEAVVRFDPDFVQAVSIAQGALVTDLCGNTWWHTHVGPDSVFISHVAMCGPLTMTGPGVLSTITFHALSQSAVTPIAFDYIEFYDAGEIVPSTAHNTTAVVTAACPATGACCTSDGNCQLVDESGCAALGGDFQGYLVECLPNLCPQSAVCCVGETCQITLAGECAALGGDWHPLLSECDPNPCVGQGVGEGTRPRARLTATPNPSAGAIRLAYSLAAPAVARIDVFDVSGRCVRRVLDDAAASSEGLVEWDGCDAQGRRAAPGAYLCRLSAGGEVRVQRMVMLE
jgi:hypothetical protein